MLEVFKQPKYMPELGLKKIMYLPHLAKQRLIVIHMAVYCLCQPQVFRRMKFIFMHSHFFKNSAAAAAAATYFHIICMNSWNTRIIEWHCLKIQMPKNMPPSPAFTAAICCCYFNTSRRSRRSHRRLLSLCKGQYLVFYLFLDTHKYAHMVNFLKEFC